MSRARNNTKGAALVDDEYVDDSFIDDNYGSAKSKKAGKSRGGPAGGFALPLDDDDASGAFGGARGKQPEDDQPDQDEDEYYEDDQFHETEDEEDKELKVSRRGQVDFNVLILFLTFL